MFRRYWLYWKPGWWNAHAVSWHDSLGVAGLQRVVLCVLLDMRPKVSYGSLYADANALKMSDIEHTCFLWRFLSQLTFDETAQE